MSEMAVERRTGEGDGDGAGLDLANRKRALMRQMAEWLGWDDATMSHLYGSHVAHVSDER